MKLYKKLWGLCVMLALVGGEALAYEPGDTISVYTNSFPLIFQRDTVPRKALVRAVGNDFCVISRHSRDVLISDLTAYNDTLFAATITPQNWDPLYYYVKFGDSKCWEHKEIPSEIDTNRSLSVYRIGTSNDLHYHKRIPYIATSHGLIRTGPDFHYVYRVFDIPMVDIAINPLTHDSILSGTEIIAATPNGVYRLLTRGPAVSTPADSERLGDLDGPIYAVAIDPLDTTHVLCGRGDGVYEWNGSSWSLLRETSRVKRILFDGDGNVYVATRSGLYKYNGNQWQEYFSGSVINDVACSGSLVLVGDSSGNAYLSTNSGEEWELWINGFEIYSNLNLRVLSCEITDLTLYVGTNVGVFKWGFADDHWINISDGIIDYIGDDKIDTILASAEDPFGTGRSVLDLLLDSLQVSSEELLDVDGDPHLLIMPVNLIVSRNIVDPYIVPVYGYFDPYDENPAAPHSNAREILVLNNSLWDTLDLGLLKSFLSYLVAQYICYSLDPAEGKALRAGLAMYGAGAIGFDVINGFIPGNQFSGCSHGDGYYEFPLFSEPAYGGSRSPVVREFDRERMFLFTSYIKTRFGKEAVLSLLRDTLIGSQSVERMLAEAGYGGGLKEFYNEWVLANLLDYPDTGFYGGIYGYPDLDLPDFCPYFAESTQALGSIEGDVQNLGFNWGVLSGAAFPENLFFNGVDDGDFSALAVLFDEDGLPDTLLAMSLDSLNYGVLNIEGLGGSWDRCVAVITRYTDNSNGKYIIGDTSLPSVMPPARLSAESGHRGYIPLSWASPPVRDSLSYTYNVYRAIGHSGGPYDLIASNIVGRHYVDSSSVNDIPCYYVVTSVKNGRESGYSEEAMGISYSFPPPRYVSATGAIGGVLLKWQTPYDADAGNLIKIAKGEERRTLSGLTGYLVYRGDSSGVFSFLDSVLVDYYFDDGATCDTVRYYYYVVACYENPDGVSPAVDTVSAVPRSGSGGTYYKHMVTINTGDLWNYTTDFGAMGGEGNSGFLGYTWPGGVGLNNYYLWLSYIWAGAMIAGEPHVTWHDYVFPEWGPGPDPVSVESRGDALQITTHFNDCASFNSYNADGSHLGLEMTMRALSWNEPVLRNCIAWELDIIYHPSECDIPGAGDSLMDFYVAFLFDADVSGADFSDPHIDDLVDYDGWDGEDTQTDEVDSITLNPDGTYETVPDGVPDEFLIFGDEPDEHTLNGDTLIVSRNAGYMYDWDNPATPENDVGENGRSQGYMGLSLIYAPPSPSDSTWVEDGDTLRMVLPAAMAWWDWENDPPGDLDQYQYMQGTHPSMMGYRFMPNPLSVNTGPFDYRILLSVGPITLRAGERKTIVLGSAVGQGLNGGYDYVYRNGEWVPGLRHFLDYLVKAYYWGSTNSDPVHPSSPYEDFHWGVPPLGVSEGKRQVVHCNFNVLPNVTRGVADVSFTLPSESDVEISLYDVTGRLVKRILRGHFRSGKHSMKIDFNNGDIRASDGVYFLRFKAGKKRLTRKILLLR